MNENLPGQGQPSTLEHLAADKLLPSQGESTLGPPDLASIPFVSPPAAAGLGEGKTVSKNVPAWESFEILRELGRGGMGVVYLARQKHLERTVALKMILHSSHVSSQARQRFLAEAETLAQLSHPGIVQVYEFGMHGDCPYFALEYLEGGGLDRKLQGRPLPAREAAALAEKLALATQAAHERGIIHRDLKPANVLLAGTPDAPLGQCTPKIADFGLAKQIEGGSDLTATGMILGTPGYMAPEQAAGATRTIGPATDVYALGAILYECLTGRPPFQGAALQETLGQVLHREPVGVRQLQPDAPKDLDTICHKCLHKEPARRYGSAAALAADLRAFLEDRPIAARPVSQWEKTWRWCRRNPSTAGLVAAVMVALLAGTMVSVFFALRASEQAKEARHNAALAQEQTRQAQEEKILAAQHAAHAERQRLLSDRHLYDARMVMAQMAWEQGRRGQAEQLLDLYRQPAPHRPDLRGWEWYCQDQLFQPERRRLPKHDGDSQGVAFSPDGAWLATGDQRHVRIWDLASTKALHTLDGHGGAPIFRVKFSPDGTRLASVDTMGTVILWDAVQGRSLHVFKGQAEGYLTDLAFSPDGRWLAGSQREREVTLWEVANGQKAATLVLPEVREPRPGTLCIGFSPDGRQLATTLGSVTGIFLFDVPGGNMIRHLRPPDRIVNSVTCLVFSPDGRWLAVPHGRSLRLWDVHRGEVHATLQGHNDNIRSAAFSPDGSRLATASWDRTVKVWDVASQQLQRSFTHPHGVYGVTFSPDGLWLASGESDGSVRLWDPAADAEFVLQQFFGNFTFSPDGTQVASYDASSEVKLYDTTTGQVQQVFAHASNQRVTAVVFSPDGTWLATASKDRTVKIWPRKGGPAWRTLEGHAGEVGGLALSPNGRVLASASEDGTVKLWEAATGKELFTLRGHRGQVNAVAFRPDGVELATGDDHGTVKLWEAATGTETASLHSHDGMVPEVRYSPDGRLLAVRGGAPRGKGNVPGLDKPISVWDVATKQRVATAAPKARGMAFSPNGAWLALGHEDGTIDLWDTSTRKVTVTLRGHSGWINSVAFSPDGERLVSAGQDKTVRVWDIATGQEVRVFANQRSDGRQVGFSPDPRGSRLAMAASGSAHFKMWDARPVSDEIRQEREAVGMLKRLYSLPLSHADVRAYVTAAPGVRPETRQAALALMERFDEETNPEIYHQSSWATVLQSHLTAPLYQFALRQAETACRLAPEPVPYRNALGAAQYRNGKYQEALATLTAAQPHEFAPADLAFLAMTQHRLGQHAKAKETLALAFGALKKDGEKNAELAALLREAELLIEGRVGVPRA
jgi:eukaryotic-like serine/threonine-protein kinase